MEKLTEFVGGRRWIRNDPLFLVYLSETVPEGQEHELQSSMLKSCSKNICIPFQKKSTS